jgi:hypothetical protein
MSYEGFGLYISGVCYNLIPTLKYFIMLLKNHYKDASIQHSYMLFQLAVSHTKLLNKMKTLYHGIQHMVAR